MKKSHPTRNTSYWKNEMRWLHHFCVRVFLCVTDTHRAAHTHTHRSAEREREREIKWERERDGEIDGDGERWGETERERKRDCYSALAWQLAEVNRKKQKERVAAVANLRRK